MRYYRRYVELKNTPAAVEAYRRAVDLNPRDYRAWYGLGQTYEILQMFFYALHYYRTLRLYGFRSTNSTTDTNSNTTRCTSTVRCDATHTR